MTKKTDMPKWDDLQQLWQDSPDVDMTKLARHARFVWWRMRLNFAIEIIACMSGIGFFGWELIVKTSFPAVLLDSLFIALCMAGIWGAFYIRRGAWGEPDGSALSLVELQIKRAKSAIRYVAINNWGCLVGVPLIGLVYWVILEKHGELADERLARAQYLLGLAVLLFILFPILSRPYVNRKKRRIEELERLTEQLKRSDDAK